MMQVKDWEDTWSKILEILSSRNIIQGTYDVEI